MEAMDGAGVPAEDGGAPVFGTPMEHDMPPATDPLVRRGLLGATAALLLPGVLPGRAFADVLRATPTAQAAAHDAVFAPALAGVYRGQIDPAACLVSEKYDGVRALWDGRVLRHRSGRRVSAPAGFVAALPAVPLDGELWLERGRFDALSGIVRKAEPVISEWAGVRFMVFDMPGMGGSFAERSERLAGVVAATGAKQLDAAPQSRGIDAAALQARLAATVAVGGEGLMLHLASAPWIGGRSDALMKLKPHLDAEARVVGHRPGIGKYRGLLGALAVEAADGRRFLVGSGLTDALRRLPPPLGAAITYRYRDLTSSGLPRFATYVRAYEPL